MSPPRILTLAGSLQADSPTSRLAAAFAREVAFLDAEATQIALVDYPLPLHDAEQAPEVEPMHAVRLRGLLKAHQGVFIATPEIAGSIPALLKNVLDWLAPALPRRIASGRLFAIAGASEGGAGARGALDHLRSILAEGFGATLIGAGLAIAHSDQAFDDKGRLNDPAQAAAMQQLARELVHASRRLAPEG